MPRLYWVAQARPVDAANGGVTFGARDHEARNRIEALRPRRLHIPRISVVRGRPDFYRGLHRDAVGRRWLADLRDHSQDPRPRPGRPRAIPSRHFAVPRFRPRRGPLRPKKIANPLLRGICHLLHAPAGRNAISRMASHALRCSDLRGRGPARRSAFVQWAGGARDPAATRPRGTFSERGSVAFNGVSGRHNSGALDRRSNLRNLERTQRRVRRVDRVGRLRALCSHAEWPPSPNPARATSA